MSNTYPAYLLGLEEAAAKDKDAIIAHVDKYIMRINALSAEWDGLAAKNAALEIALKASGAGYDEQRARVLELEEKVAFLESREVCAAAHENVETCGYCQRDEALSALGEYNWQESRATKAEMQRDKLVEALRACLARWDWIVQPMTPEPPVFEMERVRELLRSCGWTKS